MSQLEPFMSTGDLPPSRNRSTWGRRIAALIAVGVALAMIGLSVLLLRGPDESTDYAGAGTGEVTVVVSRGDTLTEIGAKLQEAGVVLSAESFVNAASVDDRAGSIGPGRYTMRQQMNSIEALDLMLDPASRADSRLVLPEGLRLEQTVAIAAEATSLPKANFQKALQEPEELGLPDFAKDRPEGFMFPATYDLTGEETAKGLLRQLVKRFDQASADVGLEERASGVGLTPYQVLIVASLLQAEVAPGDFAKVARVVYNRLDQDMPLQFDSTVSYALGLTDIQLNEEQLKTSSPYNTYVRRGPAAAADQLARRGGDGGGAQSGQGQVAVLRVRRSRAPTRPSSRAATTSSSSTSGSSRPTWPSTSGSSRRAIRARMAEPVAPGRGARLADRALPVARPAPGRLRESRPGLDLRGDRGRRGGPGRASWPGSTTPGPGCR